MRFSIEALAQTPVAARRTEIVECKGLGHPDTLCDYLAEAVARRLAQMYERELGFVAHFNVDKALLAAGECEKTFGYGRLIQPMRLYLGDRATFHVGDRELPVVETIQAAVAEWLERNLRLVRAGQHLLVEPVMAAGSAPLRGIYQPQPTPVVSNDTSGAVGFAPMSPTEQLVLQTRTFLNGPDFLQQFPDVGEDIKIFAVRSDDRLSVTIAMPFLCDRIDSEATYFRRKEEVLHELHRQIRCPGLQVDWTLNALDRPGKGAEGLYLSLLGTSAEDADSGQLGRGNRACGLIPFSRPVGGEAAAGKNPVAHVGKIYSLFSQQLAQQLHQRFPGLREVYVSLATRIGEPVSDPWVQVQVVLVPGASLQDLETAIEDHVAEAIDRLPEFSRQLIHREFVVA